jgi:hypothetical protein
VVVASSEECYFLSSIEVIEITECFFGLALQNEVPSLSEARVLFAKVLPGIGWS